MQIVRTYGYGFVATGSKLSITNGSPAEVRAMILEREAKDKERRKAYRKPRTLRPGSKLDTFTEYNPQGMANGFH